MKIDQANVMVDLRQVPARNRIGELESELGGLCGVRRARGSKRASRLLLVDYDPKTISSQQILDVVVRQGFDARLIGM